MARSFNGTTDLIDFGNPSVISGLSAVTVSIWVNISSLAQSVSMVMSKINVGSTQYMQLQIRSSGKLAVYLTVPGNLDYDNTGSQTVSANTWTHLAFVFDNTNSLIGYVNGVSDATVGSGGTLTITNGNLQLGNDANNAGRLFPGKMANFAIYNVALTAAEIGALAAGFLPTLVRPAACVMFAPLDGLQSPEPDLSGNANNGTLTGTALASGPPVTLFTPRWPIFQPGPPPVPIMGQIWI